MTSTHTQQSIYFLGARDIPICAAFGCGRTLTLSEQLCGDKCQQCQQLGGVVGKQTYKSIILNHIKKIKMNTIVNTVPKEQYADIESGLKNFIVLKTKQPPLAGQRLLLIEEGFTGKEIMTEINYVESGSQVFKGHYILQFPAQKKQDPTSQRLEFNSTDKTWSKEELSGINTEGMIPGSIIQNNEDKPDIVVN